VRFPRRGTTFSARVRKRKKNAEGGKTFGEKEKSSPSSRGKRVGEKKGENLGANPKEGRIIRKGKRRCRSPKKSKAVLEEKVDEKKKKGSMPGFGHGEPVPARHSQKGEKGVERTATQRERKKISRPWDEKIPATEIRRNAKKEEKNFTTILFYGGEGAWCAHPDEEVRKSWGRL